MLIEVKEVLSAYTLSSDVNNKAKRNRHPDSLDYRYLKKDTAGNWITGYTPGFYPIEHEQALMEEREDLARAGVKFNLQDEHDPFLSLFKVELALPENKLKVLDTEDPVHLFTFRAAIASGFVAPRREEVGVGKYAFTTYYFEAKEMEDKKVKEISKIKLTTGAIISKNENERAWLIIQCFLSGMVVKPNFENDTLFSFLAKKLESFKTVKEVEELLNQFKRKNQEIESVFVARQAVDANIVKYDNITKEFTYTSEKGEGVVGLGASSKDVEIYLNNPTKAPIFSEIRKAVYKKFEIA